MIYPRCRTVPPSHRDHHRRVHARPLVARAVTEAVDRRGVGAAARRADRRADSCRRRPSTSASSPCRRAASSTSTHPTQAYGPWLLADTGLVIEGTGYVLDLSSAASPPPWPPDWHGLWLGAGTATGETTVPDPCNTGYLRGHYTYDHAIVVSSRVLRQHLPREPCRRSTRSTRSGSRSPSTTAAMDIWYSKIVRGELKNGWTRPAGRRRLRGRSPGNRVRTPIAVVSVQPDLDLAGALDHGGREISWGELTHHGDEVVAWTGVFGRGLPLPSGRRRARPTRRSPAGRSPDRPSTPSSTRASPSSRPTRSPASRSRSSTDAFVFSPDRPGGRATRSSSTGCTAGSASASPVSTARSRPTCSPGARNSATRRAPATWATSRSSRPCSSTTRRTCSPSS